SWESAWNERKLEVGLYGTNDRAWKMWEQAKKAESRSGTDALETYYLTVMMGFRGDLRDNVDKLRTWTSNTQARIFRGLGQEWPTPAEDRKSTRLNSSHVAISYAVFCLKKKKKYYCLQRVMFYIIYATLHLYSICRYANIPFH